MNSKLENIFSFLNENRKFNHDQQEKFYLSVVSPHSEPEDKLISLLYHIANTQSQPRIDYLSSFFKSIYQDISCLKSMESFIGKINPYAPANFKSLYDGMKKQDGWGKKTAALFTKCVYHFHNGQYSGKLKIWNDVPSTISEQDQLYLPVDSVITSIFEKVDSNKKWSYDNINSELIKNYRGAKIEVWDDLWFWGFITQKGSGKNRTCEWNENKYWILKESDKNPDTINEIREKTEIFLKILKSKN
jgi:hypothetical protein